MIYGFSPHEAVIFVSLIIAGFYMAWSIGANDVANAMGTSVGSGALTLKRAVIVAAVLEFSGAFFFGSHVAETVQKGIIRPEIFASDPQIFVLGMLASLIGVGVWLQLATYYGWPVSTTHSMVGALVGFGGIVGGYEAIHWENVSFILSSWVLSPIAGGILGFGVFLLLRKHIFYRSHPLSAAKKIMPYLVFGASFTLSLLLIDGISRLFPSFNFFEIIGLCLLLSLSMGVIVYFLVRNIKITPPAQKIEQVYAPEIFIALEKAKKQLHQIQSHGAPTMSHQVKSILEDIDAMKENLSHPEEYESSSQEFQAIEGMFSYLQIASACLMAFAHGANDVANAIGPLSAAVLVLREGTFAVTAEVPTWALALGGVGIIFGLATWGWRVIETIGKKLTELTPTRGFSAEFAAALTVLVASRLGMPISTTHTLVGAVVGVGLARGLEALNLATMKDIILSWFITVPAGAIITIGIFWLLNSILY